MRWVLCGILMTFLTAVSYYFGRLVSARGNDLTITQRSAKQSTRAIGSEVVGSGNEEEDLSEIQALPAILALGDEILPESQADDGTELEMPPLSAKETGSFENLVSGKSAIGDYENITTFSRAFRVSERRQGRYRGVCVVREQPSSEITAETRNPALYRIVAIVPPLNDERSNAGWVFQYMNDVHESLISESGEKISHPDLSLYTKITQSIIAGQASVTDIYSALRSLRYPHSRSAVFVTVGSSSKLPEEQRKKCLKLLACPAVAGLLYFSDVSPIGSSTPPMSFAELRALAGNSKSPALAELVLEAGGVAITTSLQLDAQVSGGFSVFEALAAQNRDFGDLPDRFLTIANDVCPYASTEAFVKLLETLNGFNRSPLLRRLFHERTVEPADISRIVTTQSSKDEVGALAGKIPVSRLLDFVEMEDSQGTEMLLAAVRSSAFSQEQLHELAVQCYRIRETQKLLEELASRLSTESMAVTYAMCGESRSLASLVQSIAGSHERIRILNLAANAAHQGGPDHWTLELLIPYGDPENILRAIKKLEGSWDRNHACEQFLKRPDLTPAQTAAARGIAAATATP